MHITENYIDINKESWNIRTDIHINSAFYDMKNFMEGNTSLNSIELDLLGDITGLKILHLQCHFGQDSISLTRLGASVTAIDLSDKAIEKANELKQILNVDTQFICCNIYDVEKYIDEKFDIVYTSYGTITWLPDLDKWASIINTFLKPNGRFIFVEFHPVVWMFDDNFNKITYNYFNDQSIIETEQGTYADKSAAITQTYVTWNHSLSEVFGSLINNNLTIEVFKEYDYSPYNCFNKTIEIAPKKFKIAHLVNKIPMVYALVARKFC